MTPQKRLFDLLVALLLGVMLLPTIIIVAVLVLLRDGRPVFYVSERMKSADTGFSLIKFRTMKPSDSDSGASGGHKAARITKIGRFLRRTRLDEVPQLWNVLKGDISFVGPRPPLRLYVERFPEIYGRVLKSRPGITGLASVYFQRHEARILGSTSSEQENEDVYCRVCIPKKAKLDLIYQDKSTLCLDIAIMIKTILK
jgi:lipopolysaccharide/colanic/teichoic acid biosynthesis glycosyltransferase